MQARTNLRRMKGSRRRPEAGDVFRLHLPSGKFLFGFVRLAEPLNAPMPGAYLVYIYDWQSATVFPDYSKLRFDRLLMPPLWTDRTPWTLGYFRYVENRLTDSGLTLRNHCFRVELGHFVDETGKKLEGRSDPCGEWMLMGYRWIDDEVSNAIGIDLVSHGDSVTGSALQRTNTSLRK